MVVEEIIIMVDMIYYIWADVPGLQKFGSYLSIGGNDGNFVYLGFKPAVLWIKSSVHQQTQHHGVSSQMKLISLIHSTIHSMLTTMVKKENVVIMLTLAPLMLIS